MNLLQRIIGAVAQQPEQKQSGAAGVIFMRGQAARWSGRNYAAFADEGYRKNVVAFQAVNKIARAVASVNWEVTVGTEVAEEHPLLELLRKPNPAQKMAQFFETAVGYFMLSGNMYLERVAVGGVPRELYALRSDRMQVTPGQMGWPTDYRYKLGGDQHIWPVMPDGTSDIMHMKTFNPLDDWYGLSPIEAGAYAIDQHNEAMAFTKSLLQNSATPSGAFEVSAEGGMLTDDQYNRLKTQIEEQYAGAQNAGRPMLLEGGMSWKAMGMSPEQMNVLETRYASARDISLAIGVPPLLLNIPGDSTYTNYKEARLALWEETVIPLLDNIADEFNDWLTPFYGDRLRLRPNLDSIPAIADKRREIWAMADASNDLTVNEKRELKGYGKYELSDRPGDQILVGMSMVPLELVSVAPEEEPEEEPDGEPDGEPEGETDEQVEEETDEDEAETERDEDGTNEPKSMKLASLLYKLAYGEKEN